MSAKKRGNCIGMAWQHCCKKFLHVGVEEQRKGRALARRDADEAPQSSVDLFGSHRPAQIELGEKKHATVLQCKTDIVTTFPFNFLTGHKEGFTLC